MRNLLIICLILSFSLVTFGQVGIGTTTPDPNAVLDLSATDKGFLLPRMTQAQRNSIASPSNGMIVFNTTANCIEMYRTSRWWNMCENSFSAHIPTLRPLLGGNGTEQAYSIQQTADGGYIVVGYATSSNSGSLIGQTTNGQEDGWIVKLDNTGAIQWQRLLGGDQGDQATYVHQTTDGGYVVAGFSYSSSTGTLLGFDNNGSADFWILKLDETGNNILWQQLLGGNDFDQAYSIQQTADGGFIIVGVSYSDNFGTLAGHSNNGDADYWILKLDVNSDIEWQHLYGGSDFDVATAVRQTVDGGYIVAGYTNSSNSGDLTGLTNNGIWDNWILKLEPDGDIEWQKLIGGSGTDQPASIDTTANGGYIVAGFSNSSNTGSLTGHTTNGQDDYWIVKLESDGDIEWQRLIGGTLDDQATSVKKTSDGGYIIAGFAQSSNTGTLVGHNGFGDSDYWIVKLDNTGTLQWQNLLGGSQLDQATSVWETTDAQFIIAGYTASSNTGSIFGLFNNGVRDYWIIKLDQLGN